MTQNPILKVLSTLQKNRVQCLLMGGQACVFYGAAEFSRDVDIAVLIKPANLKRLSQALSELEAKCIAVPSFEASYLKKGHAVHFRCYHPDALGMRVDIMTVMRNVEPFEKLWLRRTTLDAGNGEIYDLMSLQDLVQAKKTQRDKDWPMIRGLVEVHYHENQKNPTRGQILFWIKEARTPHLLQAISKKYPQLCSEVKPSRPLLEFALSGDEFHLAEGLEQEEKKERELDRQYWLPLRRELERLRLARVAGMPGYSTDNL